MNRQELSLCLTRKETNHEILKKHRLKLHRNLILIRRRLNLLLLLLAQEGLRLSLSIKDQLIEIAGDPDPGPLSELGVGTVEKGAEGHPKEGPQVEIRLKEGHPIDRFLRESHLVDSCLIEGHQIGSCLVQGLLVGRFLTDALLHLPIKMTLLKARLLISVF